MRAVVFTFLLAILIGFGSIYYRSMSIGEVSLALKQELRDKHNKEIAIAKLTKFEWDELFLVGPYQPTSSVCKRLALSQADCVSTVKFESTGEGEILMIFRHNGKVVHSEMHVRGNGDFTVVPVEPFTPESAVFSVSIEEQGFPFGDWWKLRPILTNPGLTGHSSGPSKAAVLPPAEVQR